MSHRAFQKKQLLLTTKKRTAVSMTGEEKVYIIPKEGQAMADSEVALAKRVGRRVEKRLRTICADHPHSYPPARLQPTIPSSVETIRPTT